MIRKAISPRLAIKTLRKGRICLVTDMLCSRSGCGERRGVASVRLTYLRDVKRHEPARRAFFSKGGDAFRTFIAHAGGKRQGGVVELLCQALTVSGLGKQALECLVGAGRAARHAAE